MNWFSDGVDWVGDKVEDGFDAGEKLVGEGVEDLSHITADGLDKIGLDGTADFVRNTGDDIADDLGAHVGERQLGQTDDPKQLVHGDVGKIDAAATDLTKLAVGFAEVGAGLQGIDAGGWTGEGGDAFHARWSKTPKDWFTAEAACTSASSALTTYASTVTWAQGQAQQAINQWNAAKTTQQNAIDTYNAQVDTYNAAVKTYNSKVDNGEDPGDKPTKPAAFEDPGPALFEAAQQVLDTAREQRNAAAATCAQAIKEATATAPPLPKFHDRMGADFSDLITIGNYQSAHFTGGILKGTGDLLKFARSLNPTDPYNLTHPAGYLQGLSDTGAGLVYASVHPGALVHGLIGGGWGSDPAEAAGKLIPNILLAVGTDGAGAAADVGTRETIGVAEDASKVAEDLGTAGEKVRPEDVKVDCGDPVDVATGAVFLDQVDLHLPGVLPLVVRRRHVSDWRYGLWFGRTWSSTFDERIDLDGEHAVAVLADARIVSFPHPTVDEPARPLVGSGWRLHRTEVGGFDLVDERTGQVRHYLRPIAGAAPLAATTEPTGHRIAIVRAADGTPTEIRHTGGYRVLVGTEDRRITGLTVVDDDGGNPVTVAGYRYVEGRLAEVVNASGEALRFGYDEDGRLTAWADRNGTAYHYVYDEAGRCVSQGGTDGVMANRFDYTVLGEELRETAVTDSQGAVRRFWINARSQVVAEIDPLGNETRSTWDDDHRLLERTDALGRSTRFGYDGDLLTAIVRPDGSTQTFEYVVVGGRPQPARVTLPDGTAWTSRYDERGNRVALVDPLGVETLFEYDEHGHLVALADPTGAVRRIRTDGVGLPVEVTEPTGAVTHLERDGLGRVVALVDALGARTELAWTPDGQLAQRVLADGSTETWRYDGEGNPIEHVDAAGRSTRTTYTHFDLPATVTTPDGATTAFTYDAELRLTAVTNASGAVWRYQRDAAGRLVAETDFNGRTQRYAYDAAGAVVARTNGAGETVGFAHDALGNVVEQRVGDAVTRLAYDPLGRLLRASGPEVELVIQRDPLGRVVAESLNGHTVTSAYDQAGRRIRRQTPAGVVTEWTHGVTGVERMTMAGHVVGFQRDLLGREIRRTLAGTAALDQTWDDLGRLVEQRLTSPIHAAALASRLGGQHGGQAGGQAGGAAEPQELQRRRYGYTASGSLAAVEDRLTGARRFELDLADRITSVAGVDWSEVYAYDPMGNIVRAAVGGDDSQRREYDGTLLTRAGRSRYAYDPQGRLVRRTRTRISQKAETWHYRWDAEDRLVEAITPDGTKWRYLYDVLGRRVAKRRLDEAGAVLEETRFAWDGLTLVEETTDAGRSRSWSHVGLAPAAQVELSPQLSQDEVDARFLGIVTDLVGAPTELVSAEGELVWHARRSLWGASQEPAPVPLRFPGQYADDETGLCYNLQRYYDPETGRYVSQDPLGLAPAPNPSAYVDNPTTTVDPLGLAPCENAAKAVPEVAEGGGRLFVTTGRGVTYDVPKGWTQRMADNGKGLVFQRGGATGNADMIRIMEPTAKYSEGYVRVYNSYGQPVDVFGKPGPASATHISQDYLGEWPAWPQ